MNSWLERLRLQSRPERESGLGWKIGACFLAAFLAAMIIAAAGANALLPHPEGREWISALAGWAGGAGAVLAAILALPELRAQTAESRTQTRFMVGDAEPTLTAMSREASDVEEPSALLRLVNWNRRAIAVEALALSHDVEDEEETKAVLRSVTLNGGAMGQPAVSLQAGILVFDQPIIVEGWENRSAQPPVMTLRIVIETTQPSRRRWVAIDIICQMAGMDEARLRLRATCVLGFIYDPELLID